MSARVVPVHESPGSGLGATPVVPDPLDVPVFPWCIRRKSTDSVKTPTVLRSRGRRMTLMGAQGESAEDEPFNREEEASIKSTHSHEQPQTATVLQQCSSIRVVTSSRVGEGAFMFFDERSMNGKMEDFNQGEDILFEKSRNRAASSQFPIISVSKQSYIFLSHTRGVSKLSDFNETGYPSSSLAVSYRREKVAAVKLLPDLLHMIGSREGLLGCAPTELTLKKEKQDSFDDLLSRGVEPPSSAPQAAFVWIDAYGFDQTKLTPAGKATWPMMTAKNFMKPIQHASHMAVLVSPTYFNNLFTLLELVLWSELHGKRFELPNLLFLPVGWPFRFLLELVKKALTQEGKYKVGEALASVIMQKLQVDLANFSEGTINDLFMSMSSNTAPKDKAAEFSRIVDSLYGSPGRTLWERSSYAAEDPQENVDFNPFSMNAPGGVDHSLSRDLSSSSIITYADKKGESKGERKSTTQKRRRGGYRVKSEGDHNRAARSAAASLVCRVQSLAVKLFKVAKLPHNLHLMELYIRRRLLDSASFLRFMSSVVPHSPFDRLASENAWKSKLGNLQTHGLVDINAQYSWDLAKVITDIEQFETKTSAFPRLMRVFSMATLPSQRLVRGSLGDVSHTAMRKQYSLANMFAHSPLVPTLVEAGAQLDYLGECPEDVLSFFLNPSLPLFMPPVDLWMAAGVDLSVLRPVSPKVFLQYRDPRLPRFQLAPRELWLNFLDAAVFFRRTELACLLRGKGLKHSPNFVLLLLGAAEASLSESQFVKDEEKLKPRRKSFDSVSPFKLIRSLSSNLVARRLSSPILAPNERSMKEAMMAKAEAFQDVFKSGYQMMRGSQHIFPRPLLLHILDFPESLPPGCKRHSSDPLVLCSGCSQSSHKFHNIPILTIAELNPWCILEVKMKLNATAANLSSSEEEESSRMESGT